MEKLTEFVSKSFNPDSEGASLHERLIPVSRHPEDTFKGSSRYSEERDSATESPTISLVGTDSPTPSPRRSPVISSGKMDQDHVVLSSRPDSPVLKGCISSSAHRTQSSIDMSPSSPDKYNITRYGK